MKTAHMLSLKFISFLVILLGVLSGCGGGSKTPSSPYSAEVLTLVPTQPGHDPSSDPQFQIEQVNFNSLEDLDTLTGKYFEFYSGGTLRHTLKPNQNDRSEALNVVRPSLHYTVKKGVIIPSDTYTLTILSTAYHFDSLLSELKTFSGIDPEDFLRLRGKFKVYFDTELLAIGTEGYNDKTVTTNAAYVSDLFGFITLKSSPKESVPFASNALILTHEFGHLMYDYLVNDLKGVEGSEGNDARFYIDKNFRGFNEGWADLTSYMVTGYSNSLAASLQVSDSVREKLNMRDFAKLGFNDNTYGSCEQVHSFYCLGTMFANSFYQSIVNTGIDPTHAEQRQNHYKLLVQAIKESADIVRNSPVTGSKQYELGTVRTRAALDNSTGNSAFKSWMNLLSDSLSSKDSRLSIEFKENLNKNFSIRLK